VLTINTHFIVGGDDDLRAWFGTRNNYDELGETHRLKKLLEQVPNDITEKLTVFSKKDIEQTTLDNVNMERIRELGQAYMLDTLGEFLGRSFGSQLVPATPQIVRCLKVARRLKEDDDNSESMILAVDGVIAWLEAGMQRVFPEKTLGFL